MDISQAMARSALLLMTFLISLRPTFGQISTSKGVKMEVKKNPKKLSTYG